MRKCAAHLRIICVNIRFLSIKIAKAATPCAINLYICPKILKQKKIMGHIEEVATRLKGLREALGLSVADVCAACGIEEEKYTAYEQGTTGIPVSTAKRIAEAYGVEIMALLFGEEPKMNSYYITRKGSGETVERRDWYKYQSLAAGFMNRSADPFVVTVEPKPDSEPIHYNSHAGQEFTLVLEGRMMISIDGKELILNEGDSLYFNSKLPHGMKALDGKTVRFLAIIM